MEQNILLDSKCMEKISSRYHLFCEEITKNIEYNLEVFMKTTTKYFNQVCKDKYVPLGFIKKKSVFARIRGDIIQSFSLKRYRNAPLCTVEFGIFPLCDSPPLYLDAGQYELDNFRIDGYGRAWMFDPKSEESRLRCVESISDMIDRYLLPFFDACSDSRTAMQEMIRLEEVFENNRQEWLKMIGTTDESLYTWQEGSLSDEHKYYMALKNKDWSYVEQYLNLMVEDYKMAFKEFDDPDYPEQPDIVIKNYQDGLAEFSELLDRFNAGDYDYFDELVKFNEIETKKFLALHYPKLLKK